MVKVKASNTYIYTALEGAVIYKIPATTLNKFKYKRTLTQI